MPGRKIRWEEKFAAERNSLEGEINRGERLARERDHVERERESPGREP